MSRWLTWVAFEWAIICAALWLLSWSTWMLPLTMIVIGSRQHALGVLGHEAVHRAIGGIPLHWSDRLGNLLCMWPILSDVDTYRRWHMLHHQHLGSDLDPERAQRDMYRTRYSDLTPARRAWILAGDCLGLHADEPLSVLKVVMGPWSAPRAIHALALSSVIVVSFGLLPLLAFISSLFTVFWASMRWRIWHEHIGPDVTLDYRPTWLQRLLFVPHYIWRHVDHHRPGRWAVPCWELRGME